MTDILDRIKAGEDSFTEFKSENFQNDSLAKEIVAFSNMNGGSIFIGIENDGTIAGITDLKVEERVINICRNSIEPSVLPQIKVHRFDDKLKFLELIISKGDFKPYKVKGQNRIYIRVGSISIEPSVPELIRLFQSSGQYHYEVSKVSDTDISNFDKLRFRNYCETYRNLTWDDESLKPILKNLELMTEDESLSIVGFLFFANNSGFRLPQSGIQLIHFEGNDKTNNIIDHKELECVIPDCIEAAIQFVQNNSRVRGIFSEDTHLRKDIPEYDPYTIRELIANAFCHRDWSIFGQKIRLIMYSDRLEIFSPGGLPNTMQLENALAGVSYYRNPVISQICKDYGITEKAGRGLEKIMKRFKELNFPRPIFDCKSEYISVTIPKNL